VIDHNDGFSPTRERGAEVQSSIFAALDRFKQDFEKISGVNEVTQGAEPRNASGVAIDSLREAAQTKIRLKARNVETWLTHVGQQQASRILQFYSIPRIIRITENENAVKYFKVAIDETVDEAGETQRTATVQETQEVDGQMVESAPIQYEIKSNLDVRITTGTSLPFAKSQRANKARELFQLGIYDEDDLLTDMEHPRKEKILEKLTQRKQQQAEQEAALAAQQQVPGASAGAPPQAV
jgi:flavin-binding protein dodecin